jgi:hypothetical protein
MFQPFFEPITEPTLEPFYEPNTEPTWEPFYYGSVQPLKYFYYQDFGGFPTLEPANEPAPVSRYLDFLPTFEPVELPPVASPTEEPSVEAGKPSKKPVTDAPSEQPVDAAPSEKPIESPVESVTRVDVDWTQSPPYEGYDGGLAGPFVNPVQNQG